MSASAKLFQSLIQGITPLKSPTKRIIHTLYARFQLTNTSVRRLRALSRLREVRRREESERHAREREKVNRHDRLRVAEVRASIIRSNTPKRSREHDSKAIKWGSTSADINSSKFRENKPTDEEVIDK